MAQTAPRTTPQWDDEDDYRTPSGQARKLFDVTCVIGTVYATTGGDMSPRMVAHMMIVEHEAKGTYTFPHEDGTIEHVTIEWEKPESATN